MCLMSMNGSWRPGSSPLKKIQSPMSSAASAILFGATDVSGKPLLGSSPAVEVRMAVFFELHAATAATTTRAVRPTRAHFLTPASVPVGSLGRRVSPADDWVRQPDGKPRNDRVVVRHLLPVGDAGGPPVALRASAARSRRSGR